MSDKVGQSKSYFDEQGKMPDDKSDDIGQTKKTHALKDTNRPRRKKAKQACIPCKKAHLTCGDERPCKRCIKRGIADACKDVTQTTLVRRYLALAKALNNMPRPAWDPATTTDRPPGPQQNSSASDHDTLSTSSRIFSSPESGLAKPSGDSQNSVGVLHSMQINQQSSYVSPTCQDNPAVPQPQMGSMIPQNNTGFNAFFDTSNPVYRFDLGGLDFSSQYTGQEHKTFQKGIGFETPPHSQSRTPTSVANYATTSSCPSFEGKHTMTDFFGTYQTNSVSPSSHIPVIQNRPEPRCCDHDCNGQQFSSSNSLLHHQRD